MKKIILSSIFVLIIDYSFGQTNTFPASGNVGIGTTSPAKKLDIKGNGINLENTTYANLSGIIYKNGARFISNFTYGNNGTVVTSGNNTFVGYNAGNFTMGSTAATTAEASYNTAVGSAAFSQNTTGYHNTTVGYASLRSNISGNNNTVIGCLGLYHNLTGINNTALGYEGLYHNTTGSYNTSTGYASLSSNTAGTGNTADGYTALDANSTGSYNVAVGYQSLFYNSETSYNVAIGYRAGNRIADGTINSGTGTSIFIGADTRSLTSTASNEIVIGYGATGAGSNSVVLGNSSVTKTLLQGNVGMGTSDPQSKLAVNGTVTAKQVKVTQTGWPDYVFDPAYRLPPLKEVSDFIKQHKHLPQIPSAREIDEQGLDLGDMQQKQVRKMEEMTLYLIKIDKEMSLLKDEVSRLRLSNRRLRKQIDDLKNRDL